MIDLKAMLMSVFYSTSSAFFVVGLMYLWTKSDLFNRVQGWLEARHEHWFYRFLSCGYCLGSWLYLSLYVVTVLIDAQTLCFISLFGAAGGLGMFYHLWAAFRKNWSPLD